MKNHRWVVFVDYLLAFFAFRQEKKGLANEIESAEKRFRLVCRSSDCHPKRVIPLGRCRPGAIVSETSSK